MSTKNSLDIKIPTAHYVGYQKRSGDELPLGFMTPDGTDKAAEKRKATVDSWASGSGYGSAKQATLPASTYENKPMVGFKIAKLVAGGGRGWDARSDAWRIEDPRGFQLEIGSGNFQEILEISTIEKGEILEECIWGRLGSNNILIPTASEVYTRATTNTERMGKRTSVKDVKPGMKILFQNGTEAIYYGRVFGYGYTRKEEDANGNRIQMSDIKLGPLGGDKHMFAYRHVDKDGKLTGSIELKTSLKIAEVLDDSGEITQDEACNILNKVIAEKGPDVVDVPKSWGEYYAYGTRCILLGPSKFTTVSVERELVAIGDSDFFLDWWDKAYKSDVADRYYLNHCIVGYDDGNGTQYGTCSFDTNWKNHKRDLPVTVKENSSGSFSYYGSVEAISPIALLEEKRISKLTQQVSRNNFWGYGSHRDQLETVRHKWPNATPESLTFYKLKLKFKDLVGNDMEVDYTYR